MRRNRKLGILAAALCLCLLAGVLTVLGVNQYRAHHVAPLSDEVLASVDTERARKLMIVAHPDDETLWGGGHLDGTYLILCLTNGNNPTRSAELSGVAAFYGCQFLCLSYPDKVNGFRDNWRAVSDGMRDDIGRVLRLTDWELVVTHNADGEYGHIHHKMTHTAVADLCRALSLADRLRVFGSYRQPQEGTDGLDPLPPEALARKEAALALYLSQEHTVGLFTHMNPYENWREPD